MTKSIKKKLLFYFIAVIGVFLIGVKITLANFISDDFNDYTIGNNLTTESGGYWKSDFTVPTITGTTCQSGNCVNMDISAGTQKDFYATSTSIQTYISYYFYQQYSNTAGSDLYFRLYDASNNILDSFYCRNQQWRTGIGGSTSYGDCALSTWHLAQIQIDGTRYRTKINGNDWSPFLNMTNYPSKVFFTAQNVTTNGTRRIDELTFSDAPISNQVSFSYPQNGTVIKDFTNFNINYSTASSSATYVINVQYGRATSTTEYTDGGTVPYVVNDAIALIPKENPLQEETWYARAYMYENDNLVAYTSQINFLIDNTNGSSSVETDAQFDLDRPTDAELCEGIDTSSFFGGIVCGFRQLIVWAFYPSQNVTNKFNNSFNDLKDSFPFSAYFGITDTISGAIASTSVSGTQTFDVPMLGTGTSTFVMTPVLSSSSISNAIGASNANIIRTSLSFIIRLFFIIIIYFTLR